MDWQAQLDAIRAMHIENGVCPDCGGAGEVFDLAAIARTGNPFSGVKCRSCRGDGRTSIRTESDDQKP